MKQTEGEQLIVNSPNHFKGRAAMIVLYALIKIKKEEDHFQKQK